MKKIGVLFGMDSHFAVDIADKINQSKVKGVKAEIMSVGAVSLASVIDYNVIFDNVSFEVPYFRSVLKKAAFEGVNVVNNPFKCCSIDNFFNVILAKSNGLNVPKTAIIPSKEHPRGATSDSMRNLMYPLNWDKVLDYIGFPLIIKPNNDISGSNSYKVYNKSEFFAAFDFTGSKIMLLQEFIDYSEFFRAFVIGKNKVIILRYDPAKPLHLRYLRTETKINEKLAEQIKDHSVKLVSNLDYDFNVIDFAVKNQIPYAIEHLNPIPRLDREFMYDKDYNELIGLTADMLIEYTKDRKKNQTK